MRKAIEKLKPFNKKGDLNVVIETHKGDRNKFRFDEKLGLFKLTKVLPFGMEFPYDFGFVPGTEADDGDPLDALVLMDSPVFSGCVVECCAVGLIEAEQNEDGKKIRNDRIIAKSQDCREFVDLKDARDLNKKLIEELEEFFHQYNKLEGRKFKLLGLKGPAAVKATIDKHLIG